MPYKYMILDSHGIPVARGLLENHPEARVWQIRVLDNGTEAVLDHEVLQLLGVEDAYAGMIGRVLRARGDIVELEPMGVLEEETRQNLRVQVNFETYLYVLGADNRPKGRIPANVHDISCGGIAFFCVRELERGQLLEIVVSITEQPLILSIQVLRTRPSTAKTPLYAAKFVELTHDEEKLLREAVFGQQIKNSNRRNLKSSER